MWCLELCLLNNRRTLNHNSLVHPIIPRLCEGGKINPNLPRNYPINQSHNCASD